MGGRDGEGKGVGGVVKKSGDVIKESRVDSTPFKISYLRHNELEYVTPRTFLHLLANKHALAQLVPR